MANVMCSSLRITLLLLGLLLSFPQGNASAECLGDCDNNNTVGSADLTKIIAIINYCACSSGAIGGAPDGCPAIPGSDTQCLNADRNHDNCITAGELTGVIADMINFPSGCPSVPTLSPTNTPIPPTAPPSPTASAPMAFTSTATLRPTPTATIVFTSTAMPSPTATAIIVFTSTATATPTATTAFTSAATLAPTSTTSPTPSSTPAANPSSTPTATATATPGTVCGNGVIEPGETCTTCPADCTVHACTATTPISTVRVNLAIPPDETVSGLTLLVGYKSGTVSLPGSGAASTVGSRIKNKPSNTIFAFNDLDYALRTVLSRSSGFSSGQLYTIDFDSCQGAAAVTIADFACTVEGCSNTFGTVIGCTCSVSF